MNYKMTLLSLPYMHESALYRTYHQRAHPVLQEKGSVDFFKEAIEDAVGILFLPVGQLDAAQDVQTISLKGDEYNNMLNL